MNKTNIWKDFDVFSRALITSKDVDPVYPFVKNYLRLNKDVEGEWFIFLYVMFYSLDSAIKITREFPLPGSFSENLFRKMRKEGHVTKFGHERRGSARNVDNQIKMVGAIVDMCSDIALHQIGEFQSPLLDSNQDFRDSVAAMPFHGGWAAFKIAELFEKSLGYKQFEIPDLGLDGRDPNSNDGPVSGLRWLFGREEKFSQKWFPIWNRFGENLAKGWGTGMGEVETCFCKFHKFVTGKYYIGHDIHEFLELRHDKTIKPKEFGKIMKMSGFHPAFWDESLHGVQKDWKPRYAQHGEILYSEFADKMPELDIYEQIMEL